MLTNLQSKIGNIGNPLRLYEVSRLFTGAAGIIIALVSLTGLIKILPGLFKEKAYVGNEPYLAASAVTLAICIVILIWGFKGLIGKFMDTDSHDIPVPPGLEDSSTVESALVQKELPWYESSWEAVVERDKSFIKKFLIFLGLVIVGLIVKMIVPDEFFWRFRLTPGYFSFPLLFMVILAATAALRGANIYFHSESTSREIEVLETIKSIKGEGNPFAFTAEIEKALSPLEQNETAYKVIRSGYPGTKEEIKLTGKIHQRIFIETQPKYLANASHPIVYLFLLFAVVLLITGFLFLAKLPPGNISVLTVPGIAIGYVWGLVKGFVLVVAGRGLWKDVFLVSATHRFESVVVYVEIEGDYETAAAEVSGTEADTPGIGGTSLRCDCHFKVYTTTLNTENDAIQGKRHILKMAAAYEAERAKKMVIDVIDTLVV